MKRAPAPGLIAVLVLATFLAFSPILSAGFINWDDPVMVTQNATITGLTWSHLVTFFTTLTEKHYHPLVFISYAIDSRLFGLRRCEAALRRSGGSWRGWLTALSASVGVAPVIGPIRRGMGKRSSIVDTTERSRFEQRVWSSWLRQVSPVC